MASGQATESYTYNALGETLTKTDRNGSAHSYSYDILGRPISDQVTSFGSGVDQQVKRIDTAYDTGGRPYLYTSYSDTGGTIVVNQVQQSYNGLGQLSIEYQSHSGSVNISATPKVQYGYSFVSTSGGPNHSRLVSITYPNTVGGARVVAYNYNSGVDDRISRVSSMSDSSATLESYSYLGLATVVKRAHPQSGVDLTYIKQTGEANGDAGDQYTGLDRFGRVVDQRWIPTASPTNPTDRLQYTYDRDNNRLTRSNLVNTSFNEQYGYDGLNQLTSFSRGTHSQSWSLDAVGNWSSFTSDSNTQTRTANVQNQITSISGATTPAYDNNGNTTTDETGKTYVYDAWNRLVKATSGSNNVAYTVDSLSRRITTSANGGSATDLYYSSQWQVLEEDVSGSMTAQYVWSPVYVDALVERDTTSQRLYVQQDANWNVTSVVDTTGTVQERYAYDPYGKPTDGNGNAAVLTPAWASRATSLFSWIYLDQGGRFDATSGLYSFRNRDLSPTLGRWMEQDPIGYAAGDDNLYQEEGNSPTNGTDPLGLAGLKYYLWDAPLTFAGNVIVGAVNVPVEGAKLVYDVAGVATQILSMGSHQAFGTEVYQFELQSSLLRGMEAAPNPEAQGRFVVHAMANTMTLNGLAVVESRDSKELAQNLGAFGVNLGLAGVALGKGGKGAPTRPAAPSVQPGTWQPPPPSFTIRNPSFPPSAGNTPIFPMGPDFLPPGAGGGPIPPPPGWNPPPWNPNLPFKAH